MRILVIILCAALPQALCASNPNDGNANSMMDTVLKHWKNHPDVKSRFNPLHMAINKSLGIVTLNNITIPDLGSKLKRTGNAVMTYDKKSNVLDFSFEIGADDLEPEVTYAYKIWPPLLHTTKSGTAYGTIGRLVVLVRLHLHNYEVFKLDDFLVTTLSNVRIRKITGLLRLYSALVKTILNEWFYEPFVEILRKEIQEHGRTLFQKSLTNFTISGLTG